jgi:hypothetical protein
MTIRLFLAIVAGLCAVVVLLGVGDLDTAKVLAVGLLAAAVAVVT